jgi:CheY-like chemotaxis protein/predicted DNA-binding protein (MmcQ/YjbR family)
MGKLEKIEAELREKALTYPGTYEERPWGERVTKVKGKIFLFAGASERGLSVTTKLPISGGMALTLPFAKPTGYGLGKSGWVTAHFKAEDDVPTGLLLEWLDESYRALAPKKLVKELASPPATEKSAPKKKVKKRPAKKKPDLVLLVGDDELRLERTRAGLGELGLFRVELAPPSSEAFESARAGRPRAIVIDLGRRPGEGFELGVALSHSELASTPLVFAGARDAAAMKRAKSLAPGASCFRQPPGDARVLDALASALGVSRQA